MNDSRYLTYNAIDVYLLGPNKNINIVGQHIFDRKSSIEISMLQNFQCFNHDFYIDKN